MKKMMYKMLMVGLILSAVLSCKKKPSPTPVPGTPAVNSRQVTYELEGLYDGDFIIVISDNSGATETFNDITSPWTYQKTYSNSVMGIGIGTGIGSIAGQPGQTVVMNIYAGGIKVKTATSTAGANGLITLPNLVHLF